VDPIHTRDLRVLHELHANAVLCLLNEVWELLVSSPGAGRLREFESAWWSALPEAFSLPSLESPAIFHDLLPRSGPRTKHDLKATVPVLIRKVSALVEMPAGVSGNRPVYTSHGHNPANGSALLTCQEGFSRGYGHYSVRPKPRFSGKDSGGVKP
jgi:hypothetical protein